MAGVLIVSPNPGSRSAGGVERFCHLLATVLRADGHDVRLAGPTRSTGRWASRLGLSALLESRSIPTSVGEWEPDVLISNGLLGGIRHPREVSVIHVFHGTMVGHVLNVGRAEPLRQRLRQGVGGGLAEALAARGALNVAVSESAAREAWTFYRSRVDRVIPNGVDTWTFKRRPRNEARRALGLPDERRLALFVGRAEPGKGPEIALESCRRAGFELLVAGPRSICGARNLGVFQPEALPVLYSAADCVVFPTRYEACSFVVLEALACGVPLVTTPVGWIPTLLRNVPSYSTLVARADAVEFAHVLKRLRTDPSREAVDAAHDWVRGNCSLEQFGGQWRRLVAAVLEGRPATLDSGIEMVAEAAR
jgi:glycosyltransferase involved in cell wall biosynthesis